MSVLFGNYKTYHEHETIQTRSVLKLGLSHDELSIKPPEEVSRFKATKTPEKYI